MSTNRRVVAASASAEISAGAGNRRLLIVHQHLQLSSVQLPQGIDGHERERKNILMTSKGMTLDFQWDNNPRYIQFINPTTSSQGNPRTRCPLGLTNPANDSNPRASDLDPPLPYLPISPSHHLTNPLAPRRHQWAAAHRMGSPT